MISGSKVKRSIGVLLFCAACWLAFAPALAGDDAGKPAALDLKQLMTDLGQVKIAKARFVERKYLNVLKEPLEFSGTLVYTAPSRLEKNTLLPKPESLLVEENKLTIERADGQRRTLMLQDYPEIWAFVESIRATLAGDLQTLSRFYQVSLEGDIEHWQLSLKPSEQKMRAMVSLVKISGNKNWVDSIEIQEADGDHSIMTVLKDGS
jgi:outer membrane lipoprotein-sorting protein